MKPIKDNNGLLRDEKTNAVININDVEYDAYLAEKREYFLKRKILTI